MKKVLIIEYDRMFRLMLVITDIIMPIMEGIETIIALHKLNPKVKIIAMSGGGQMEPEKYLDTALALKVNAVLKKPFSYKELLRTMALIEQETG